MRLYDIKLSSYTGYIYVSGFKTTSVIFILDQSLQVVWYLSLSFTSLNYMAFDISQVYLGGYDSSPSMASVIFKTYASLDETADP